MNPFTQILNNQFGQLPLKVENLTALDGHPNTEVTLIGGENEEIHLEGRLKIKYNRTDLSTLFSGVSIPKNIKTEKQVSDHLLLKYGTPTDEFLIFVNENYINIKAHEDNLSFFGEIIIMKL